MVAHRLWEPGVPSSSLGCPTMINSDRVLVCGSRDWDDPEIVRVILDGAVALHKSNSRQPMVVIEGAARGADSHAGEWARRHPWDCQLLEYPADWDTHGRAAGPIRNKQMLEEGQPTVVFAFSDNLEESRGTANMVAQAKKAGVPVYVIARA